jgi:hypothetical protein
MSIYTYKSAKSFCEFLDIEFEENILVSDQELSKIPKDAFWVKGMSTKGIPKSEESKIKLSKERVGRAWYYNPNTFFEKQFHEHEIPESWIKGRNPTIKHGGRLGVYNSARYTKIPNTNRGKIAWNRGIVAWNKGKTFKRKPETSPRKPMEKLCCPNCGLVGSGGNMIRYHFNNCKMII